MGPLLLAAVLTRPTPPAPLVLLVAVGDLAMLAYAFLVVAAATQHARHPPPLGLIPLTCNEIQHLFAALARQLPATVGTGCAGRAGDAASKPALVPATTDGKPPGSHSMKITKSGWSIRRGSVAFSFPAWSGRITTCVPEM